MIRNSHTLTTMIEISDIPQTTPRGVQVVVKDTGKTLWLPRRHVDFMPGVAIVPVWLVEKIKRERGGNAASRR